MLGYKVINLKDVYNSLGEERTKEILDEYECTLNEDVEYFLKEKSIEFAKQDIAETFLIVTSYRDESVVVGYFALANKGISIKKAILSETKKKKFLRYAKFNSESKSYQMALPLIGQLGKNYYNGYDKLISGDVLLKLACDKVKEAQDILGGRFVFLECEDKERIKSFYESNGFVCFSKRNLEKDEMEMNDGKYLLQMLCDLSKK